MHIRRPPWRPDKSTTGSVAFATTVAANTPRQCDYVNRSVSDAVNNGTNSTGAANNTAGHAAHRLPSARVATLGHSANPRPTYATAASRGIRRTGFTGALASSGRRRRDRGWRLRRSNRNFRLVVVKHAGCARGLRSASDTAHKHDRSNKCVTHLILFLG